MQIEFIMFDTETNGFQGSSLLSISAIKASYDTENNTFQKLDTYDRYYYVREGEEFSLDAAKVHGLYPEEVDRRRDLQNASYPKTFVEDVDSFKDFCGNIKHFVAHNIKFDRSFIPFKLPYQFDTMLENINILQLPGRYGYKWPKLMECAEYYSLELDEKDLHNSLYDVTIMGRVLYKMSQRQDTQAPVKNFFIHNKSTRSL